MGIEDEVGGMSLGIPEPGLKRVLDASEINDICEKVFNQSADLYDLRIFDFARAVEALVIRKVKEKREARAHHQASALFPVEEI